MLYVASVRLGDEYSGHCDVHPTFGKGHTEEEAVQSCLERVRSRIEIDIEPAPGVQLPPKIAAKMPTILPDGCGLLILVRCSHGDGHPYDWRFFAIRCGRLTLPGIGYSSGARDFTIGETPAICSFLDSNSDYEFPLPEGSEEFVDGKWVGCQSAQYDY